MPVFLQLLITFVVGGTLCVLAQLLIDLTRLSPARILVGFVVFGVFLGGVGLFAPLYAFAGCGVSVPLLGFGGAIAKGVREAVIEQGLLGALTGGISATAGGISASLIFGYLVAIFAKSKPKSITKRKKNEP